MTWNKLLQIKSVDVFTNSIVAKISYSSTKLRESRDLHSRPQSHST